MFTKLAQFVPETIAIDKQTNLSIQANIDTHMQRTQQTHKHMNNKKYIQDTVLGRA